MALGSQFPLASCQVRSSLGHARPTNPMSGAPSLYVISLQMNDSFERMRSAFSQTRGIAVVFVDPPSKLVAEWPSHWTRISKPFGRDRLIKAASTAVDGLRDNGPV